MTNSLTMIIPTETEILQSNSNEAREHVNNETSNNNNNNNNNAILTRGTNYYHNNARLSKPQQHQQQLSSSTTHSSLPFVGLVYVQDTLPNKVETDKKNEILLGTVLLVDTRPSNAHQLRQLICQQAVFTMDKRYIFLTNIG